MESKRKINKLIFSLDIELKCHIQWNLIIIIVCVLTGNNADFNDCHLCLHLMDAKAEEEEEKCWWIFLFSSLWLITEDDVDKDDEHWEIFFPLLNAKFQFVNTY